MATGEEIVCIPRYMGETADEAECFTIGVDISSLKPHQEWRRTAEGVTADMSVVCRWYARWYASADAPPMPESIDQGNFDKRGSSIGSRPAPSKNFWGLAEGLW